MAAEVKKTLFFSTNLAYSLLLRADWRINQVLHVLFDVVAFKRVPFEFRVFVGQFNFIFNFVFFLRVDCQVCVCVGRGQGRV